MTIKNIVEKTYLGAFGCGCGGTRVIKVVPRVIVRVLRVGNIYNRYIEL